jgi:uncharacterized membrane protein
MLIRPDRLLARLDHLSRLLLVVLALAFISLPIVRWTLGEAALRLGVVAAVVVQAIVVVILLGRAWPLPRLVGVLLAVIVLGWAAEYLGSQTGFPFGRYHYTDLLQPQVGGVPLLIPLAWLMMLPPSWAIASAIVPASKGQKTMGWKEWLSFALISSLAMTAWDLFLDPQMTAWNFWVWEQPSGYFGIPWINFLGWMLVTFLITLVVRPRGLPTAPLAAIYALTWFLETFGQLFFWGLPGPAVCGFLGMGSVLFWAALSHLRQSKEFDRRENR